MKTIQKLWRIAPGAMFAMLQTSIEPKFSRIIKRPALITLAFMICLLPGCENDDVVKTNDVVKDNNTEIKTGHTASINDKEISGNKLVHMNLGDDSFVSFWELSPGNVGIRISKNKDEKSQAVNARITAIESKLDVMIKDKKSVVDIYNAIAVNPNRKEVEVLRSAMARREALKQKEINDGTSPKEKAPGALELASSLDNGRTKACSPDYYNDSYGANWFLSYYCVEGAYRFCPTNIGWAYSGLRKTTWFKTSAMAADFNEGAQFQGWYWKRDCFIFCGNWYQVPFWNYTVLPRRVETWYISVEYGESRVDSGCRAHFSALWYL